MTAGNPGSRPLIPGAPGSPDEITAEDLGCIPIDWSVEENRPLSAMEVDDSAFHAWVTSKFPAYVQEQENRAWPIERRAEVCNRLWQAKEIWGVTYVESTQEDKES